MIDAGEIPFGKPIFWTLLVLIILLAPPFARAEDPDAVLGTWNESDGDAQFEIYRCGSLYCGKIVSLRDPDYPANDPMAGKPKIDRNNPDPKLRTRPLLGMPFMLGFRYEGSNSWKGLIYNPEDGQNYRCRLAMAGWNHLKVRGYLGIVLLGKTVVWTRAR